MIDREVLEPERSVLLARALEAFERAGLFVLACQVASAISDTETYLVQITSHGNIVIHDSENTVNLDPAMRLAITCDALGRLDRYPLTRTAQEVVNNGFFGAARPPRAGAQ